MLTYHTIIEKNSFDKDLNISYLEDLCKSYNMAKHKAFAVISKNNKNINNKEIKKHIIELTSKEKSELVLKYNLTGRHINSINYELKGILSSYIESQKLVLSNKKIHV